MRRAFIRYHGGKFRLAPKILPYFPPHKVYTEVFGGAASVLLQKPRSYAEIYNDLDGEIVNLFRVVRNPAQCRELERQLRLTPYSRTEYEQSYLADGDPIEQARRTMVRACQGFGSNALGRRTGWRIYSRDGRSASPSTDWMNLPNLLVEVCQRLQGVFIENRPAAMVLQKHDSPRTLHYVDPPYVQSTRTSLVTEYHRGYKHELSDDDHRELAAVLHSLKGMVVLSGYGCDLYDELFGGWRRIDMSTMADGGVKRTESLWLNPAAQRAQAEPTLFDLSHAA